MSDYTGHSIPYALTADEIDLFLERHSGDLALADYIVHCQPPYGIIVNEAYGEYLVWQDQTHPCGDITGLHVIDVTNLSIAQQVKLAPYESQDPGVIQSVIDAVLKFIASVKPTLNLGLIFGIAVVAFLVIREAKK